MSTHQDAIKTLGGNTTVGKTIDRSATKLNRHVMITRLGALALAISGLFFVLYPAIRPFSDEASLQGAAAFASPQWILAHTLAILGFILLTLGIFALYLMLQTSNVERPALWGLIISWLGVGLTLPFYGAEVFALHAIGQQALSQQNAALLSLANQTRFGPGFIMIITGLILLALGAILIAVAIWRSKSLPKWSGVPFALALVLYIPQFVASQPVRVAHGLLLATGCLWIAMEMWGRTRT
jgi:uncharacterized membrane protein